LCVLNDYVKWLVSYKKEYQHLSRKYCSFNTRLKSML
jgi:hypothetical protein